ncbi:endonuclease domain-containing protein [Microlunatus parietis]|uniref:Very-short-patch-repair endonuclease n=1 Tax=Microlunatus parietis TaxID=682979 RepID=A0A7Y9I300_9ACTN|nr:DUF559 domain-containing protein [Microlunatus parietis]NYE69266.1 very-short-patch-repair endonuclease [Microlunatus parietis]
MRARNEIARALRDSGGVFRTRDHPQLARSIQRLTASGVLTSVLPGIHCAVEDAQRTEIRVRAAALWAPDAVFTGPAAGWLSEWPDLAVPVVTLSGPMRRTPGPGFRVCRERIPDALITRSRGCWSTVPALTALNLVPWIGPQGIDDVLRTGSATVDQLWSALSATPRRPGNSLRRAALIDSRKAPWSEAERLLHSLLREAGIRGWSGNVVVPCGGRRYPVDVVFDRLRLIIEVDGYAFHRAENQDQFHRDRRKWTDLTAAGWTVLHLTWDHLVYDRAWVVDRVRQAMAQCRKAR